MYQVFSDLFLNNTAVKLIIITIISAGKGIGHIFPYDKNQCCNRVVTKTFVKAVKRSLCYVKFNFLCTDVLHSWI